MTDTDYTPSFRVAPRRTDDEREAHTAYCEELRALIAEEGQRIRAELAAKWPQQSKTPAE